MPLFIPNCIRCKHLFDENDSIMINGEFTRRCAAFPNVIPIEIYRNKIEHNQPYPGDKMEFNLN